MLWIQLFLFPPSVRVFLINTCSCLRPHVEPRITRTRARNRKLGARGRVERTRWFTRVSRLAGGALVFILLQTRCTRVRSTIKHLFTYKVRICAGVRRYIIHVEYNKPPVQVLGSSVSPGINCKRVDSAKEKTHTYVVSRKTRALGSATVPRGVCTGVSTGFI